MRRNSDLVFGVHADVFKVIYAFSVFLHILAYSAFATIYHIAGHYNFTFDSLISNPENLFIVVAGGVSSIILSISLSVVVYRRSERTSASPKSSLHLAMISNIMSLVLLSGPGAFLDFSLIALPFIGLAFIALSFLILTACISARSAYRDAAHLTDKGEDA